ncbi:D-inositol-3-phosphate glycosyltransferase [uncultured Friedmanniella sp.]|uniref:D-inositol-3-phosphate glycosyltransferase n=1 Tax=uncultured Friedmanniella sp. TaxID=335381 RepID=UPI0035C9C73C
MTAPVEYPQRIAMISMHTSPLATPGVGDAGGLNVYVSEVARRLGERGIEVDVFTRAEDDSPDVVEVNEHTRVVQVPAGPRAAVAKEELPAMVATFAEAVRQRLNGHELVHTHYWLSGMVGLELAEQCGLPLVHTMHTMARVKNVALGQGQTPEPDVRDRGEAQIVVRADVLTANTVDEARELHEHYGARPEQVAVVPPGVDLHTFHPCDQPKSRAQLGIGQDDQVILFVGRIQPLKAPDVLIRAVAELVARDPTRRERLRLIIIGSPSGPQSQWSQGLVPLIADLGVADLVELRPHSPRAELFRWYCVADVVGVPSHNESFGLVALEAQACGRPVVATDVGGLRHAVRDGQTGLLVRGHEAGAWADALATVLDSPGERVRMGANAAGHSSRFSWDNTAAATLAAYHAATLRKGSEGRFVVPHGPGSGRTRLRSS